ncbi:SpaA isopeptide-forming pilin-related protein [Corynebacterium sp.]|uniref:SpaA isopeptide-forming pilin-related protein n=1 Tax=Corynebacterium sp. TaxID=1720 RepID=UPI0026E0BF41|nr:SpaA isopeptide-forming pilin-related protein [Corynebacterium sp.]MDO5512037.1 SpaA isopeptide-forming pilin-related protein [Corynebacterium sp.]
MRIVSIPTRIVVAVLVILGIVALGLAMPTAGAVDETAVEAPAEPSTPTGSTDDSTLPEPTVAEEVPGDDPLDEIPMLPEETVERAAARDSLAALAAPAPGGQFYDGYWEDLPVSANPPMPQRCGLNIALVFDLSNSIGANGLAQSKAAGQAFIDGLKNTPTTLGVYNFATLAPTEYVSDKPSIDLSNDEGVAEARGAMADLQLPSGAGYDRGGTNWEGALENVAESGVKYDVVYFITDGIPTTNNVLYPGNDLGSITHNIDITRAITAANTLKDSGTRLEVIAVKMPSVGASVLRDNVQVGPNSFGDLLPFSESTTWGYDNYASANFYDYEGNPQYVYITSGYWHLFDDAVRDGALTFDETSTGSSRYYYLPGADATAQPRRSSTGVHRWAFYWGTESYKFRMYHYDLDKPTALSIASAVTGSRNDVLSLPSYDQLASQLREAALAICGGTVIVEKQIVDTDGTVLEQGVNWQFTADDVRSTDPAHPVYLVDDLALPVASISGVTDIDGRAQFTVKTDTPHRSGSVRITETQQTDYLLRQQGGKNAVCVDKNNTPVTVTDDGELGFRVGIATDQTISCVVQNVRDEYQFSVSKTAQADQQPDVDGEQPNSLINFDGTFTARYDITVTNETKSEKELRDPVIDKVTFPKGFQVTAVLFYLDGKEISGVTETERGYEIPAAALGTFGAKVTKKIEVRVEGRADDAAVDTVVDGTYDVCEDPATATPRSLHNSVFLEGDADEGDNHACVDPEQPGITVAKDLVSGENAGIGLAADGTRTVTYTVTVDNSGGIDRTYSLTDTPGFAESVTVEYAVVDGKRIDGSGPYELAKDKKIAGNAKHTYQVTVHFRGPTGTTDNKECSTEGAGHGLFNRVDLTSGAVTDDDDACGPVPDPEKVSLRLVKVGADDTTTPLAGAAFALHAVDPDGSVGAKVTDLAEDTSGYHAGTLDADVEYFLVETRSPQEYELLTAPVKVKVTVASAGPTLEILNPADAVSATVGDVDTDTVVLLVADIRLGTLPKTGGMGIGAVAVLAGLIIVGGVWLLRRRP